jgi:hypothetical protein
MERQKQERRKSRRTIAIIMRDLLKERGLTEVSALDHDVIYECARRARMKRSTSDKILRNRVVAALAINAKSSEAIWTFDEKPHRLAHMVRVFRPIAPTNYDTVGYLYLTTDNDEAVFKQRTDIESTAATHGHAITAWIEDRRVGRPGRSLLMDRVREGKVRRVYVVQPDRLHKNGIPLREIIDTFEQHGVEAISAAQGVIDQKYVTELIEAQAADKKLRGRA